MALELSAFLNSTGVTNGLEKMREKVGEFGKEVDKDLGGLSEMFNPAVAAAVAFGIALDLIKDGVSEAFEKADNLTKMNEQLGIGTERLQQFSNAASHNGSSTDDLNGAMGKLKKNIQEALSGNKEQVDAFKRLGLTIDDLKDKSLDEVFLSIADATKATSGEGMTYSDVLTTMGKSAGSLIPTLKQGGDAIIEQGNAAGLMSSTTITVLDHGQKKWKEFSEYIVNVIGEWTGDFFLGVDAIQVYWKNGIQFLQDYLSGYVGFVSDLLHGKLLSAWTTFYEKVKEANDRMVEHNQQGILKIAQDLKDETDKQNEVAKDSSSAPDADDVESKSKKKIDQAQKDADEEKRLDDETKAHQEKNAYDKLKTNQKISYLKSTIDYYQKYANDTSGTTSPLERAKARNQIQLKTEELEGVQKEQDKANVTAFQKGNELDAKNVKEHRKNVLEKQKVELESQEKILREKIEKAKGKEVGALDLRGHQAGSNFSAGEKMAMAAHEKEVNYAQQQANLQKDLNDKLQKIVDQMTSNQQMLNGINGTNLSDGTFN